VFAIFSNAIQVKNGFSVSFRVAKFLCTGVSKVFDPVFAGQNLIQKVNQQVFVRLGAE